MLSELLKKCKTGNEHSILEFINIFEPILKKYTAKFKQDDIHTDLVITLIEVIKKVNPDKFNYDGEVVNYFVRAVKNAYVDIVRKKIKTDQISILELNTPFFESSNVLEQVIDLIDYYALVQKLSERERTIINEVFLFQNKETEVAVKLGITKQAVHNTKKNALLKLKLVIEKGKYGV